MCVINITDIAEKIKDVITDYIKTSSIKIEFFHRWELRCLKKMTFYIKHYRNVMKDKLFYITDFIKLNVKKYKFNIKNQNTDEIIKNISVYNYFLYQYNFCLQHWNLSLMKMIKKKIVFLMKCCIITANQCYLYKLDDKQIKIMIKFAMLRASQWIISIRNGLQILNWDHDSILNHYSIKIAF